MPKNIDVTELILRDAHQSLMATRMSMEDMVPACADLDQAGFWSVECWGGATFDTCIRFLNEDPWERLRTFRRLMPNTRLQMLLKIELPSAAPTIIAGITQCIMLSLSMVVIAALVGAGGLGVPVVRALNTVQVGMGFEAGFVIVLLAIMLDRISRPAEKESGS